MFMINGCGTRLVGKKASANGHIATKWLVVFYLPILPVQSYEVFAETAHAGGKQYSMQPLEAMDWDQVLDTGLKILAGVVVVVLVILAVNWHCF
jgi:hypothetical protein